jgi:cyclopropane-fatty-acyl-phospholipid synthase
VLHFIGHARRFDTEFYIGKHIFPGGWIPSLADTLAAMEACGPEILDVENLRRHRALTLDVWADRFDAHWDRLRTLNPARFDKHIRRKWRTDLLSCAERFHSFNGRTFLFT